eukprot:scaffold3220_cov115-Pinguiococcus_pyrenoidosus.AAC.1
MLRKLQVAEQENRRLAGDATGGDIQLSLPPSLMEQLLSFQREGVRLIVGAGGRGLIADEMGCGKTIQGI